MCIYAQSEYGNQEGFAPVLRWCCIPTLFKRSISKLSSLCLVSNPVLNIPSGFPVLPAVNEQRSVAKPKKHSCGQCGKRFIRMTSLKTHQRMHIGERPFHCEQCGSRFISKVHLKDHQKNHTGERLFYCEHCDNNYKTKNDLVSHQIMHTLFCE